MKTNHYAQWNNIAIFITKPHESLCEQKHKQINRKLRGQQGVHNSHTYELLWVWNMDLNDVLLGDKKDSWNVANLKRL